MQKITRSQIHGCCEEGWNNLWPFIISKLVECRTVTFIILTLCNSLASLVSCPSCTARFTKAIMCHELERDNGL